MSLSKSENLVFIFVGVKLYLSYVKGENENILIRDIDDRSTKYIFASKDTQAVYSNPNLQGIQPTWKVHLKIELKSHRITFDIISLKWKYVAQMHN